MLGFFAQVLADLTWESGRHNAAIRELNKLSDHLLADIGFRREQLPTLTLELADEEERDRALAPAPPAPRASALRMSPSGETVSMAFDEAARCLAELGHPHRLHVFHLLIRAGDAGLSVGEI